MFKAPSLVDLPAFYLAAPWTLAGHRGRRGRIDVAADGVRQAVPRRSGTTAAGEVEPGEVAGGLAVDNVIRSLVSDDPTCPAPWSATAALPSVARPRYWTTLHGDDRPRSSGGVPRNFHAAATSNVPELVPTSSSTTASPPWWGATRSCRNVARTAAPMANGVNLVGYLTRSRAWATSPDASVRASRNAGVGVAPLAYRAHGEPSDLDGTNGTTAPTTPTAPTAPTARRPASSHIGTRSPS